MLNIIQSRKVQTSIDTFLTAFDGKIPAIDPEASQIEQILQQQLNQ